MTVHQSLVALKCLTRFELEAASKLRVGYVLSLAGSGAPVTFMHAAKAVFVQLAVGPTMHDISSVILIAVGGEFKAILLVFPFPASLGRLEISIPSREHGRLSSL